LEFYIQKILKKIFDNINLPTIDNLSGVVLLFIISILGLLPWYVMKTLILVIGILIIYWLL